MKQKTLSLIVLTILSVASVFVLYASQFIFNVKKNGFNRSFLSKSPSVQSAIEIGFDSYYIAGLSADSILLGNKTAPLHFLTASFNNRDTQHFFIKLDTQYQHNLVAPQLSIADGKISLVDGISGARYSGTLNDSYVTKYKNKPKGFDASVVVDSSRLIFRALDTATENYYFGAFNYLTDDLMINQDIFNNCNNALFANDGQLVYDPVSKMAVYVFYYQNKIICLSNAAEPVNVWRTIDTIYSPHITVENNKKDKSSTINGSSVMVNKYTAIDGQWLYVNSLLPADNESVLRFNLSSVIDMYSLKDGKYTGSFYLSKYKGKKISDFRVMGNKLVAIQGTYLVTYLLDKNIKRS